MENVVLPCYVPLGGKHGPWRHEALSIVGKQLRDLAAQTAGMPLNKELCEVINLHGVLFMISVHNVRHNPEMLKSLNGSMSTYARKVLAEVRAFRALFAASGDKIVLSDGMDVKRAVFQILDEVERVANDLIAQAEASPG